MIFETFYSCLYHFMAREFSAEFTHTYFMQNKTKQAFLDMISFLLYTENAAR